jgi:transcriptional regulator GlxA family with amidase domain
MLVLVATPVAGHAGAMPNSRRIALVAYPGVQALDVVGPAEVFAGADRVIGGGAYALTVATPDGRCARSDAGLRLEADCALDEIAPPLDTLVIAGGWSYRNAMNDAVLIGEVRRLAQRSRRVASVCTGAFILAKAGLLDGRRATTHWASCGELADEFPTVCVEPDRIYVRDRPIITSAGVTAGMDLALALVQEDHGGELARQVARWLVMFVHRPGGQSQFSERLAYPVSASSPLRAALDAVVAEPAADHRLCVLAGRCDLSERHFRRLFVRTTGTTPGRFVERVRVEAARDLLEGGLPVSTAASRSGFGSAETMRRAFLRVIGVGPADYRARFGHIDHQEVSE